jgi:hypothetical protein
VQGEILNITIGKAAWEACSATWNVGTNSEFAPGPRKTTEDPDQFGRSRDLQDANWLLASIKSASPNISPYLCCCVFSFVFFSRFFFFFLPFIKKLFLQLLLCAYDLDKHQTVYNRCGRNKRLYEQICIYLYLCFSETLTACWKGEHVHWHRVSDKNIWMWCFSKVSQKQTVLNTPSC